MACSTKSISNSPVHRSLYLTCRSSAQDPASLQDAIHHAERLPLVPAEALRVSRERLKRLLDGNAMGASSYNSTQDSDLQGEIGRMMNELKAKMEAMEGLQAKMAKIQADKEAIAEENRRLREEARTRG